MKVDVKVQQTGRKEDYYDVVIKTYKQKMEFSAERSELRTLIGIIDNAIGTQMVQMGDFEMQDPKPDAELIKPRDESTRE